MSEWNLGAGARLVPALLLAVGLVIPVQAQQFEEEQLELAAQAYLKITKIHERYLPKMEEARDAEEAEQIQAEAEREAAEVIEAEGLETETYNEIITAVQEDEDVQAAFVAIVERLQNEGDPGAS